jgi:hypothetical protein
MVFIWLHLQICFDVQGTKLRLFVMRQLRHSNGVVSHSAVGWLPPPVGYVKVN